MPSSDTEVGRVSQTIGVRKPRSPALDDMIQSSLFGRTVLPYQLSPEFIHLVQSGCLEPKPGAIRLPAEYKHGCTDCEL